MTEDLATPGSYANMIVGIWSWETGWQARGAGSSYSLEAGHVQFATVPTLIPISEGKC